MNKLYLLAVVLLFANAIEEYDTMESYTEPEQLPAEQESPFIIVGDKELLEFASKLPAIIKDRMKDRAGEELSFFLKNYLQGQKIETLAFGQHQMRVSADGNGLDVLLEVKVNTGIDIEIKGFISKITGTYVISEIIGNCPPFKTFEDLELN